MLTSSTGLNRLAGPGLSNISGGKSNISHLVKKSSNPATINDVSSGNKMLSQIGPFTALKSLTNYQLLVSSIIILPFAFPKLIKFFSFK